MVTTNLSDSDANLYRLYAVGLLGYDEALGRAQSLVRLRRAMLAFDQNARRDTMSPQPRGAVIPPSAEARPGS
jgi:hypothetical protein